MIDLETIPDGVLMARGKYSTVRAAHEDEKKNLQILCGALASTATKILRHMQPDNEAPPESAEELLSSARANLDAIDAIVERITALSQQRSLLKKEAWGGSK